MNDQYSFYSSAGSNLETLFINRTYRKDRIVLLYQQVGSRYASTGVVFHRHRKNRGGFSSCTDYNKTVVRIFTITSDPKLETETTRFNIEFGHHRIPIIRVRILKQNQHVTKQSPWFSTRPNLEQKHHATNIICRVQNN